MKIVMDENFPYPSVRAMRRMGFDILSIQESFPGLSDTDVLRVAVREDRILLTFDRDFGERIFHKASHHLPV
jgi:predicted nuclease of predicted toxin-antitoxin system